MADPRKWRQVFGGPSGKAPLIFPLASGEPRTGQERSTALPMPIAPVLPGFSRAFESSPAQKLAASVGAPRRRTGVRKAVYNTLRLPPSAERSMRYRGPRVGTVTKFLHPEQKEIMHQRHSSSLAREELIAPCENTFSRAAFSMAFRLIAHSGNLLDHVKFSRQAPLQLG